VPNWLGSHVALANVALSKRVRLEIFFQAVVRYLIRQLALMFQQHGQFMVYQKIVGYRPMRFMPKLPAVRSVRF